MLGYLTWKWTQQLGSPFVAMLFPRRAQARDMPCDLRISSPPGYLEAENGWVDPKKVWGFPHWYCHSGKSVQSKDRQGPLCAVLRLWLKNSPQKMVSKKKLQHRMAMLILDTANIWLRTCGAHTHTHTLWRPVHMEGNQDQPLHRSLSSHKAFDLHLHFADHTTPEMVTMVTMLELLWLTW